MLGSMLPDVDKIIGIYLFPDISNGRIFLHTLLFLTLISLMGLLVFRFRRRTWVLVLAAGTLSHLILDKYVAQPAHAVLAFPAKKLYRRAHGRLAAHHLAETARGTGIVPAGNRGRGNPALVLWLGNKK